MRNKTKQNFYFYYLLENNESRFLYSLRNVTRPEQTKQYKRLKQLLDLSKVNGIGWCNELYFNDNEIKFIAPNLPYLLNKKNN
jgi:hypothetical protein